MPDAKNPPALDTMNIGLVGVRGDYIELLRWRITLTKPEALQVAAWLVALADEGDRFYELLKAVQES